LLEGVTVKLFPEVCESDRFRHFCGYNGKTSTVINELDQAHTGQLFSKSVSTICDKPVCTRGTL